MLKSVDKRESGRPDFPETHERPETSLLVNGEPSKSDEVKTKPSPQTRNSREIQMADRPTGQKLRPDSQRNPRKTESPDARGSGALCSGRAAPAPTAVRTDLDLGRAAESGAAAREETREPRERRTKGATE